MPTRDYRSKQAADLDASIILNLDVGGKLTSCEFLAGRKGIRANLSAGLTAQEQADLDEAMSEAGFEVANPDVVLLETGGAILSAGAIADGGRLRRSGSNIIGDFGGLFLLQRIVASNDATIDFDTGIDGTYKSYLIKLINVVPANDIVHLYLRVSNDGGATFEAGAGAYKWAYKYNNDTATDSVLQSASDTKIALTNSQGSAAGEGGGLEVEIQDPAAAVINQLIGWKGRNVDSNGKTVNFTGAGQYLTVEAIDAIRFLFSAGNVESGTFELYGIK